MGLFDLFKKKKITLADADKLNKEFIEENPIAKNDEDAQMRQAASAMSSGNFDQAIEAYQKLANDSPDKKGLYLSQVGAAYFFKSDFNAALEHYVQAKESGADPNMMDDNIWEACEALYEKDADKASIEKYLELYPSGSYAKKANKLLAK